METKINGADLTIKCLNETLYYCTYLLQRIPYYDALINGGFAESNTTEIKFDYHGDTFIALANFIETGRTNIIPELYEFALIVNYEPLLKYIANENTFTDKMFIQALSHKHMDVINKLINFLNCPNTYKLNKELVVNIYEFITYRSPEIKIDFSRIDNHLISKKIICLAIENSDHKLLSQLNNVIYRKKKIYGKLEKFLTGIPSEIIMYYNDPLRLAVEWVRSNPKNKEDIIGPLFETDQKNIANHDLLSMINIFIDNHDVIKQLMAEYFPYNSL